MKLKIGVFGSAIIESSDVLVKAAQAIGEQIALDNHIIVTGACGGLPLEAVKKNRLLNGYSIGYSAVTKKSDHEAMMGTSLEYYNELELIPDNYKHKNNIYICRKYRNVSSVADCDAAIFISGRWGTLNEFAIAYDTGKVIGILTGHGKFSHQAKSLLDFFEKSTAAQVVFNDNPIELYDALINKINKHHH